MAEKKKPIAELRKELKHLMVEIKVAPSQIYNRHAMEQMIDLYKGFRDVKKEAPLPEVNKPGRKPAREVESETSGEVAVPKKVAPVEREHEPKPKPAKISKADPPKVADDTPKPKRVMTEEHKAKMKAARDAKRAASTSTPEKEEKSEPKPKPKPKVAKPKKEEAPPDAPPKKEEEAPAPAPGPREKKIPVFKMGGT